MCGGPVSRRAVKKEKEEQNMNFKRVLTMLLALCLVLNLAVPGVSALTAGQDLEPLD